LLCSHNIALQLRKSFGASYLDTNIPSTSRPTLNELVTFLQQESRWINVYSGLRPDQRQQLFNLFFDVDFLGDLNATVHDITVQEAIASMRYYMGNNGEHHATLHTALLWMLGVPTLDRTHPSVLTKKFGEYVKERNLKNRHGSRPFFAEVKGFNSQRKEEIMEDEEKRGTFLRPKTFQKEREKMMREIVTMRKELSANRTQNGVMKTMLLMEMQARKRATATLAEYNSKLKQATAKVVELETKHREAMANVADLESKHQDAMAKVANLETQHKEKVAELETKHRKAMANVADLESKHQDAMANVANLETQHKEKVAELETKHREATAKIADLETKHQEATAKIANLETKHQEKVVELETKHQQKVVELETKHREAMAKIGDLKTEHQEKVVELETKHREAMAKVTDLETKHKDKVAELETILEESNFNHLATKSKLAVMETKVSAMEEQVKKMAAIEEQVKKMASMEEQVKRMSEMMTAKLQS